MKKILKKKLFFPLSNYMIQWRKGSFAGRFNGPHVQSKIVPKTFKSEAEFVKKNSEDANKYNKKYEVAVKQVRCLALFHFNSFLHSNITVGWYFIFILVYMHLPI